MGIEIKYRIIKDNKVFDLANVEGVEGIVGRTLKEEFWSNDEFLEMAKYGTNTKNNMQKDLSNTKNILKKLETKSFVKELKELKDKSDFLAKINLDDLDNFRKGMSENLDKINKRIKEVNVINKQLENFIKEKKIEKTKSNMVG